jgi:hypothetical protein
MTDMLSTKLSELPLAYLNQLSKPNRITGDATYRQSHQSSLGKDKKVLSGPKTGTVKHPAVMASEWCFKSNKALVQGWYTFI